ncbi:MAG: tetratricopeptide repeat protein [Rhodobiaceae bacterium]|nr:tetratricopeptide repeat protein [Rhodobiaceae bacterium]MCC0041702.1 tetratricopeptide repeat protein [Rhodobiaceae bacterium]MCC0053049.1 tetratricopeptide repeat protein [Rhodobiaceae bacterium]
MSDFFREVDEELRRDQLQKAWARYGNIVIGVAVLIVAATGGYRFWQWYQARTAAAAGEAYYNAVRAEDRSADQIIAALGPVADGSSGFKELARLRIAGAQSETDDPARAVAAFDAIAFDTGVDRLTRDIARVRAAYLMVDTATVADMKARVEALTTPDNVVRHSAREAIGLTAYRTADYAEAAKWFDAIMADRDTPQDLRNRTELMQSLLTGRMQTGAAAGGSGQ